MAWLEGVECMQEDGWVPNKTQWQTIREMIGSLKPEVIVEKVHEPAPAAVMHHPQPVHHGPIEIVDGPVPHSVMPQGAPPAARPGPPQRLVPSALAEGAPAAPGVPKATSTTKDQVLDTSDGQYQSEFM